MLHRFTLAALAATFVFCSAAVCAAQPEAQKPNIIIILSDDQGYNDIGYHGSEIRTPNLDRLAADGVHFTQYYAYTTCSPTRVALLTGRNPAQYGAFRPLHDTTEVKPEDMHLPNALRELGYTTHISGKWHIGELPPHRPRQMGFDTSYGYLRGQIDPYTHRYKHGDHETWHRNDEFIEEDGHVTRLITDEAVRIIREAKDNDKPFFLYVAHHAPHYPLNEPPKYIAMYRSEIRDTWRRHYAASITHMDEQIGRIIGALDETGQRGNTIVVFSSDNGGQENWVAGAQRQYDGRYAGHTTLGDNTPFRGWKTELYEGGIRVPALINWPGFVPSGQVVQAPTHILDWAPTLIQLAGGRVDESWDLHGVDLWPAITGREQTVPEGPAARFYWNHSASIYAVRQGDWKMVRRGNRVELFHLGNDPAEEHNLADDHPDVVQRLNAMLAEQRELDG